MPDQEVLINDTNLNAIANAIRRKNGLVRTYKPREMAPAIREINADAPDSREYTVTIIQSPHQTIKVRQVLGGEKQYDQSFTVSEPYWKIQATIEAEAGYEAGTLNYIDEITLDRDVIIKASPAAEISEVDTPILHLYLRGNSIEGPGPKVGLGSNDFVNVYWDEECTQGYGDQPTTGKLAIAIYHDMNEDGATRNMRGILSSRTSTYKRCRWCKEIRQDIDVTDAIVIKEVVNDCEWLEYIDLSNFNPCNAESITDVVGNCPRLLSIGNISYWNLQKCRWVDNIWVGSRDAVSLDLSHWNTPILEQATNIFSGDKARILDISNWDTTYLRQFTFSLNGRSANHPAYIIMDKPEVKFSGEYIFNNINNCKYLVPEDWVDAYKQHPNWASRASQIDSVTNYTINRGNGQVEVVPNW